MSNQLTPAALREIFSLQTEAETILKLENVTRADSKRADILLSKIAALRSTGRSTDETLRVLATEQARELGLAATEDRASAETRAYKNFLRGASRESIEHELRDAVPAFITGPPPVITYSEGPNLGFVVPIAYLKEVIEGQKLISPLLNPNVVTVVQETTFTHRPLQIPEFDLSEVSATLLGEIAGQTPSAIPTLQQPLLNTFRFNTSFNLSREFEEDAVTGYGADPIDALSRANGVALARGINQYLVLGDGVTGPQGILNGASDSGVVSAASNAVDYDSFVDLLYSVDPVYRESSKAAFLVSDAVHKQLRKLKDGAQRPLFNIVDGVLVVLGKPCYIAPDLPLFNASLGEQAAGSLAVFGDLSKYVVHASAVLQRRFTQTPGLVEAGLVRIHAQQLIDAVVCNPSPASPAIVTARLKA